MTLAYMKVFGLLIGILLANAFLSVLSAIILRIACTLVQKMEVPFGNAYVTELVASTINIILGFVVGLVIAVGTRSQQAVNEISVLLLPVNFLITSYVVSLRIRITFGRACLVRIAMVVIALVIGLVIGVPLGLIIIFVTGS